MLSLIEKIIIILVGVFVGIVYPILQYRAVRSKETNGDRRKRVKWIMPIGWILILVVLVDAIIRYH
jgi:amino acid transporter